MVDEELVKLLEGTDNVDEDAFLNDTFNSQEDPDTRIEPGREKRKGIEETKDTPPPTPIRSPMTHIFPLSSDKETLQELMIKFKKITTAIAYRPFAIRLRDHDDYQDNDAHLEGKNNVGIDDDEFPDDKVSQEHSEEISREINEAQLQKAVDEMLRQRCNLREEHQYHVDQMQNYLKSDIVWESRKERLTLPTPKKKALVVHSCQRDPKALPMTLLNQDIFYLKHDNSGPNKYILSLHKYPAVLFSNNDIEERTSRWVSKRLEKFNVYARYGIDQWKNIANGMIDPITTPDYKYLNTNDIKDMYLLCINDKVKDYKETGLLGSLVVFIRASVIWERVHDFQLSMESYHQKVNLTAPTITFPGIEKEELFIITSEPVVGMIYENNKKEKRMMIHKENHKFCDATLKRVLEGLEKYNKNVKYGYADPSSSDYDAEYLGFYEEDIRECLKHRDQMRHWEMYVNGRPLRSRRDHP
nr:hypothetical protein [Tanacetum cinerariifolium]